MINVRLFLLLNCLLFSNLVYSQTEVRPPEGPFVSMLRVTYSTAPSISDGVKGTLDIEEKEYRFEVPDLGRYSERSTDQALDQFSSMNRVPLNNSDPMPDVLNNNPQFQPNSFDSLPLEKNSGVPLRSPYEALSHTPPIQNTERQNNSFDDLPITSRQQGESGFYPPEWAQPNPLRPINRTPRGNSNNNFNPNNMGMPFPNQPPAWIQGNQINNGYR